MLPDVRELYEFCLEQFSDVPVAKRARLARALAEIIGSSDIARALRAQAEDLEEIDLKHRQLVLDFKRRAM